MSEGRKEVAARQSRRRERELRNVGRYVTRQTGRLVESADSPGTRATLAHLRAARGQAPGAVPSIWAVTMDGAPGAPRDDAPTREEVAIHEALTTFAAHQQSRAKPMHKVGGPSLGDAVRQLERNRTHHDGGLSPVRRRFNAVLTASSFDEVTHHLRGLVDLLRADEIPLDYGRLADDLYWLQDRRTSDAVLRRWGRDLYNLDDVMSADTETKTKEEQ